MCFSLTSGLLLVSKDITINSFIFSLSLYQSFCISGRWVTSFIAYSGAWNSLFYEGIPCPGFYPHFSGLKPVKNCATSGLEFPSNFMCWGCFPFKAYFMLCSFLAFFELAKLRLKRCSMLIVGEAESSNVAPCLLRTHILTMVWEIYTSCLQMLDYHLWLSICLSYLVNIIPFHNGSLLWSNKPSELCSFICWQWLPHCCY